mgnify:CR=1 FL=1
MSKSESESVVLNPRILESSCYNYILKICNKIVGCFEKEFLYFDAKRQYICIMYEVNIVITVFRSSPFPVADLIYKL